MARQYDRRCQHLPTQMIHYCYKQIYFRETAYIASFSKLDLRHQTVYWGEVVKVAFGGWDLGLASITAWPSTSFTSLSLPGASATEMTVISIHWPEVVGC